MESRIYCVVAQTVQAPLKLELEKKQVRVTSVKDTKTIVQPAGRLIAQAAHVVSKTRVLMLIDTLAGMLQRPTLKTIKAFTSAYTFKPVTTIILSARDSYELYHVLNLLHKAGVGVQEFYDFNQPDYGNPEWEVMTAIATEPVNPEKVVGILDYLPLWKP